MRDRIRYTIIFYKVLLGISVIIPSLNEEKNIRDTIESCIRASRLANVDIELICIDDCSSDSTGKIIAELARKHSEVVSVRNEINLGFGGSFWKGVELANNSAVVVIPGDNENELSQIIKYYHLMSEVGMVIPYPTNVQKRSMVRRFISKLYLKIVNLSFGVNFRYTNGTILYKKDLLESLSIKMDSFMFQTANLIQLSRQGIAYAEVPYLLNQRRAQQKSSALKLKTLLAVIQSYFKLLKYCYMPQGCRIKRN